MVLNISPRFLTKSPIYIMLSFLRQFIDLTESSNSSTFLNKFIKLGSVETSLTELQLVRQS